MFTEHSFNTGSVTLNYAEGEPSGSPWIPTVQAIMETVSSTFVASIPFPVSVARCNASSLVIPLVKSRHPVS